MSSATQAVEQQNGVNNDQQKDSQEEEEQLPQKAHNSANSLFCGGCFAHIGGGRVVLTDDRVRYHLTCFRCSACGSSLVGSPKVLRLQSRLMCVACSARFVPICAGCRHSIRDSEFLYLAPGYYHADHLNCQGCGDPEIVSRGLLSFGGGAPLCVYCGLASRGLLCSGCGSLITDQFLCHGNQRWHINCFRCTRCDESVPLGTQRICVASGQLACQYCCAGAAVTARLTLQVAMPAVAALIETDVSDIRVTARVPWGNTGCELQQMPPLSRDQLVYQQQQHVWQQQQQLYHQWQQQQLTQHLTQQQWQRKQDEEKEKWRRDQEAKQRAQEKKLKKLRKKFTKQHKRKEWG